MIPKSATPEHIIENLKVFDFHLKDEHMEALSSFRYQLEQHALAELVAQLMATC